MKTDHVAFCALQLKVLCLLLVLFSVFATSQPAFSQDSKMKVYPTFGLGIGFFNPSDVNDYVEISLPSNYELEFGTTDMFMYFEFMAGVTFRTKRFDVTPYADFALAPKWVTVIGGDDDYFYNFTRLSPGVMANYYFPSKSEKHAFFIGGGVQYQFMSFEDFQASAPGFRAQAGYSMQFGKFNLQPYAAFRYSKAKDSVGMSDFELNYTGFQIGVILSFHPPVN